MDVSDFNSRWLKAWENKAVDAVMAFYHPNLVYFDEHRPAGIVGGDALRSYLPQIFAAVPEWRYFPEQVWPIEGGFCGRWMMELGSDDGLVHVRGFDLVLLDNDLIIRNEVYTHTLKFPLEETRPVH